MLRIFFPFHTASRRAARRGRFLPLLSAGGLCWLALALAPGPVARAQAQGAAAQSPQEAAFEKSSLAWRTALHFDPGAESPLKSLINLYKSAGRITDLTKLYTAHLAGFPQDEGARVVLGRIYLETQDPQAQDFIPQSAAAHPQNALLARLHAQWLQSRYDPRALEVLDTAVGLEKSGSRRALWLADLMKAAAAAGRQDLVAARLRALAEEKALSPEQRLQWARRALELAMPEAAAVALAGVDFSQLPGEQPVEARFLQIRAALGENRRAEASALAGELLKLLAADHWRRREALLLRWQTAADEAERTALLTETRAAMEKAPADEGAAAAYGDLLLTAGRPAQALEVWQAAAERLPASRLLEDRLLDLLEREGRDDEMLTFLAARLKAAPDRQDLGVRRARGLLQRGRLEEGLATLKTLLAPLDPAARAQTLVQTARWLRTRNLFEESARVLERLLAEDPARWEARKELAEVLLLLKRKDDMKRLFEEQPMPETLAPEVRLEVVQFLISQQLWPLARRGLEGWLAKTPAEFDGRLLLAKVCSMEGAAATTRRVLEECRALCDTEARYAAWLAAAWAEAEAEEATAEFVRQERERLFPKDNAPWDPLRLAQFTLLAQQTAQLKDEAEAETLLRENLAARDLDPARKREMRRQLIQVLEAQPKRLLDLEKEIRAAMQDPGPGAGDLRLRLALSYHTAQRRDLAQKTLEGLDVETCQDISLLTRALPILKETSGAALTTAAYRRLIHLQPEERAHWRGWTDALAEQGDEEALRNALREMSARAATWKLNAESQDLLRRHLGASYWRTVLGVLGQPGASTADARRAVEELERLELVPQRRVWALWVHAALAAREGREEEKTSALAAMTKLVGAEGWVDFPDGLSLAAKEAAHLLDEGATAARSMEKPGAGPPAPENDAATSASSPLDLAWTLPAATGTNWQRWEASTDGARVLAVDSRRQMHCVDRRTGKLLWRRGLPTLKTPPQVSIVRPGRHVYQQEQVQPVLDLALGQETFCTLNDTGLSTFSLATGELLWQVAGRGPLAPSAMTVEGDLALWWQPDLARLDAYHLASGKLAWTQTVPALAKTPPPNPNMPLWYSAGVDADSGKVLVWGNGAAMARLEDGTLLWKASAAERPVTFPLELRAEDEPQMPALAASTMTQVVPSFRNFSGGISGMNYYRSGSTLVVRTYASSLAMPAYGYPGMYGGPPGSSWVTWGSDGLRLLRGDGVWMISANNGAARFSSLGLPLDTTAAGTSSTAWAVRASGARGREVGFVGAALVLANETDVIKLQPNGLVELIYSAPIQDSRPVGQPLTAAAMAGRLLFIAAGDVLQVRNAASGGQAWSGPWPEELKKLRDEARTDLEKWQNMRWSNRGTFLYDGQGRTVVLDWKALAAGGDWITPVGTRHLVCLRARPTR